MRQNRLFAAVPGALQRNAVNAQEQKVSSMRRQIGACQAKIVQGQDVYANRQWVGVLETRIKGA